MCDALALFASCDITDTKSNLIPSATDVVVLLCNICKALITRCLARSRSEADVRFLVSRFGLPTAAACAGFVAGERARAREREEDRKRQGEEKRRERRESETRNYRMFFQPLKIP